jgi:hypothetical protein
MRGEDMRMTVLLTLGCSALAALATAAGPVETDAPKPFAFGALGSLRPADAFTCRIMVPKAGLVGGEPGGAFPSRRPGGPEDYETRFMRLTVVKRPETDTEGSVLLRVEEADKQGRPTGQGFYNHDVELRIGPAAERSVLVRDHGALLNVGSGRPVTMSPHIVSPRIRYDAGHHPLACYPPLDGAPSAPGEKAFAVPAGGQVVRCFQATVAAGVHPLSPGARNGRAPAGAMPAVAGPPSVTVVAREYLLLEGVNTAGLPKSTWIEFYDPEAGDIAAQWREGGKLRPVMFEAYEIQEWEVGQPLWKRMTRRTPDGTLILACELVPVPSGEEAQPPAPMPARADQQTEAP